MQNEIVIDNCD